MLFVRQAPEDSAGPLVTRRVAGILDAIACARGANADVALFVDTMDEQMLLGMTSCEVQRLPVVVWCQNGPNPANADAFWKSTWCRRVVVVSATQADDLRDHPIFSKASVIYNSLRPFAPSPARPRDPNVVCFLGSLTPSKGFHHLARAWPAIRAQHPAARLVVVGSGRLYDRAASLGPLGIAEESYEWEQLIPHLGANRADAAARGVTFHGLLTHEEIGRLLPSIGVGVVNTNCHGSGETFCVSAVEFESAGVPVIGARRGGLLETVCNGRTGLLIDNEQQLAAAVVSLLKNPARANAMGDAGRMFVERFSADLIQQRWIQVLGEVMRGVPPQQIPLSLDRLSARTVAREVVRQARRAPWLGPRLPTLRRIREIFSHHRVL